MQSIAHRVKRGAAVVAPMLLLVAALGGLGLVAGCKAPPSSLLSVPGKANDSVNEYVYLAGSFTNWDASRFVPALSMQLVGDYTWQQTVKLPAGQVGFKMVIAVVGGSWTAYTHPGQSGLNSPMSLVDGGIGNEVVVSIPTAGDWIFTFYEKGPHGTEGPTYTITQKTRYTGAITGVVSFSDRVTVPLPSATVEARRGGALSDTEVVAVAQSDTLTGAFALEGLQDGTYSVRFERQGYRDSIVTGVQVVGENRVAVAPLRLERSALVSQWTYVVVTGDFTTPAWTPDAAATAMTLVADYTWSVTLAAPARRIEFKFPVNKSWATNYGATTGTTDALTGPCAAAANPGNLSVTIPAAGNYTFVLHEKGYQGVATQAWYEIIPAASTAPHR